MKLHTTTAAAVAALALLGTGCSEQPRTAPEGAAPATPEPVYGEAYEDVDESFELDVEAHSGTVILTGTLDEPEVAEALAVARGVDEVREVVDRLEVDLGG